MGGYLTCARWSLQRCQSGGDLGRGGRFLSRPDLQLAAYRLLHAFAQFARQWLADALDRDLRHARTEPGLLGGCILQHLRSDLSGPLQLHHGTEDEDVPLAFSIRLAEEVRAVGGIADLYTYEGDNHNISQYFTLPWIARSPSLTSI